MRKQETLIPFFLDYFEVSNLLTLKHNPSEVKAYQKNSYNFLNILL